MPELTTVAPLELGVILTQLGGGLALFLYGMRLMSDALKTVAGAGMKNLLATLTRNRFSAALAGTAITAVIQSSSVTTVLVVGFISAGLLTTGQSVGVILGANVGTTITAQIIAFKIYKYGLVMIAVGFFTEVLARGDRLRHWGTALMGLGLIFFGMELMSIATGPLRQWPPFIDAMQHMSSAMLAVAVGALFTAVVQSSSATTGVVIVLASQGLISLETGIGLIFGANIGTCATAFISAVGRPREALQAAWVHIVFNVVGVLLWVFFIPQFAEIIRNISPVSSDLHGLAGAAADTPRQIANAHTLFNVANVLLFIWFTGPLGRLAERIAPKRPVPGIIEPKYLDDMYLDQPALALDQVRRELGRLGSRVREMIDESLTAVMTGLPDDAEALERADDEVDALYEGIIQYLGKLSQRELIAPQPQQLSDYIGIANYLENIGDVIEKDLLLLIDKRIRLGLIISRSTQAELRALEDRVRAAFDHALVAVETGDTKAALDAMESKQVVNDLAASATAHVSDRLVADEPNRVENFQVESEIIENYRRINTLTRRIARLAIHAVVNDTGDNATDQLVSSDHATRTG